MIRRAYGLAIILGICGFFAVFFSRANTTPVDEKWLEKEYPMNVGDFKMIPSSDNPMQSYKMDDTTYQELNPMGIVSRTLTDGHQHFDVVVISSHERDSFHNPLACFAAQEWKVSDTHVDHLQTKLRGDVPVSVAVATKGGQTHVAVYTFEGPTEMHAVNTSGPFGTSQVGLHGDLLHTELVTAKPQFGTFFRFVGDAGVPEAVVLKFATMYLDAAPVRPIKI